MLKGLREKRGVAPSTPTAAPVTTPPGSAAAVGAVPSSSAEADPPLDEPRYGPCTDDFSSDDEEVMCPIDFLSDGRVMCPVDFSSSSEDEDEVCYREPVDYADAMAGPDALAWAAALTAEADILADLHTTDVCASGRSFPEVPAPLL